MVAVEVQKILSRANIIALPVKVSCFESHVFTILMFTITSSDEDNCFTAQTVKQAGKRRKSREEVLFTVWSMTCKLESQRREFVASSRSSVQEKYEDTGKFLSAIHVARPIRANESLTGTVVTFEPAKETKTRKKRAWSLVLFVDIENCLCDSICTQSVENMAPFRKGNRDTFDSLVYACRLILIERSQFPFIRLFVDPWLT